MLDPRASAPELARPFRMYTQHNVFFVMAGFPVMAAVFFALRGVLSGLPLPLDMPLLLGALALGPGVGAIYLAKQGRLVIDPAAETLTYRRRAIPFAKLGLVRMGRAGVLTPSSCEGPHAMKVNVVVVVSGDFVLNPTDDLPRRRLELLANRLNDTLAAYYQRIGEPVEPLRMRPRESP